MDLQVATWVNSTQLTILRETERDSSKHLLTEY